jgi:hypothetical protein
VFTGRDQGFFVFPGRGWIVFQLGRVVNHDERSRGYAVPEAAGARRDVLWPRYSPVLEQDVGCCSGAAMVGWLGCAPHALSAVDTKAFDLELAHKIYSLATRYDPFPGQWPPEDTGSSGLAASKAARQLGYISGYSWAFTTNGMLSALQRGPVMIGVPWYEGMFTPDDNYRLWDRGKVAGGHEVLVRGVLGPDLVLSNSWGAGWGNQGEALLPLEVWERLRKQQADVVVPRV